MNSKAWNHKAALISHGNAPGFEALADLRRVKVDRRYVVLVTPFVVFIRWQYCGKSWHSVLQQCCELRTDSTLLSQDLQHWKSLITQLHVLCCGEQEKNRHTIPTSISHQPADTLSCFCIFHAVYLVFYRTRSFEEGIRTLLMCPSVQPQSARPTDINITVKELNSLVEFCTDNVNLEGTSPSHDSAELRASSQLDVKLTKVTAIST